MRQVVAGVALALLVVASLVRAPLARGENITVLMDWIFYGVHAPYFSAIDLGLYKKGNLDVTIKRGYGSGDTVKKVGVGVAQFGMADAGTMIIARSRGTSTKQIAMIHAKSMYTFIALADSGIRTPKDLRGKTIGNTATASTTVIFPAFAAANGLEQGAVKFLTMSVSAKFPSLLAGRVDAIGGYATDVPIARAKARAAGKSLVQVKWADSGIDLYSNGLLTNDKIIRDQADLVRRFVHASMEGWAWAWKNPDGAARIFKKHVVEADEKLARGVLQVALDHLVDKGVAKNGLGHMDPEKMKKTRDVMVQFKKLSVVPAVEDVYTNQFLPKIFVR
ncbi:MAG: ABC transporter substrate-binding protein [Nitrospinota bacterium]